MNGTEREVYYTNTGAWIYHFKPECATTNVHSRRSQTLPNAISAEMEPCDTCVISEKTVWCMSCGETAKGNDCGPERFVETHTEADCPADEPVLQWYVDTDIEQ